MGIGGKIISFFFTSKSVLVPSTVNLVVLGLLLQIVKVLPIEVQDYYAWLVSIQQGITTAMVLTIELHVLSRESTKAVIRGCTTVPTASIEQILNDIYVAQEKQVQKNNLLTDDSKLLELFKAFIETQKEGVS